MKRWHGSRVQDGIINLLDKQQKQKSFKTDKFFRYKFLELQNRLSQELIQNKIVETDNPAALSELIAKGLKRLVKANEFEFKYFVAPIRNIVPQPNMHSLFMTQYVIEELPKDSSILDIYGTDDEIYRVVDKVISQTLERFEREEEEIIRQLGNQKNLTPGTRAYELALENMMRQRFGEPQKF
ncbi:MAG: DUF507 family protein [Desulfatiglandales bacterium]